jgi:glycosyltransferase involved in cell wall biosynthesis
MKEKYKVLMLCDHPLAPSGVGIQSNYLIQGLLATGKYSFRVFGGAIKHADYRVVKVDPFGDDYIIAPTDGFGDPMKLRIALATEKPDIIILFTDPRFFIWVWEMEEEVHDICPIAYNHVWDEGPYPSFNSVLYASTDLINCISKTTYDLIKPNFPDRTNYIPHGLPPSLFHPLEKNKIIDFKKQLLGEDRLDHFVGIWVNRNARRKRPGDVLESWKLFLDMMEEKYGHRKGTLIMHTDPLDQEGPNLYKQIELFDLTEHVYLSREKLDFDQMNVLYNISDFCINLSNAEGFGLSTLESMYAGKPIIVTNTGGLKWQVKDSETNKEYGFGLDPDVRTLVGSQLVPFIYEDHVNNAKAANAIFKLFEMDDEERYMLGLEAREHAIKNFNLDSLIKTWDNKLEETILSYKENKNKKRFTCTTI